MRGWNKIVPYANALRDLIPRAFFVFIHENMK